MTKPSVTVLVTCAGGTLVPEGLKFLKQSARYDVTVVGVDGSADAIGRHFCDHFETVPMGTADNYITTMENIVKKYNVDLILPWSDGEALALAVNRDVFAAHNCQVASPDADILAKLSDKAQTYDILANAGIAHAEYYRAETLVALEDATEKLYTTYNEFVIKPALSRGGRDVFVIRSDIADEQHYFGGREIHLPYDAFRTKYLKSIAQHFPVVVMERLHEPTYDLDVLSLNGKAMQVVPRKRHNPAGIPFIGNTICADARLVKMGEDVAKIFNLSWLLDVDVMSRKDGTPVVLEVNPRMSGSCPAAMHAGYPLFDQIIALSRGDQIDCVPLTQDVDVIGHTTATQILKKAS